MTRRPRRSTLFPYTPLFLSIQVQVAVPAGPDELAGLEIALLREQVCEQRVAGDVERYPDKNVRAALVERSEEHTSELQSPCNLVCRLLLEKKKKKRLMR